MSPEYPNSEPSRRCSQLDEPTERYQGPKSLVLPRIHGNCCGSTAMWLGYTSIFDVWPRLAFQTLPMPINTTILDQKQGFFLF